MNLIQGVEYELELNLHSRVMLAFRYGIALDDENVMAFFVKYERSDETEPSSNRKKCKFNIEGRKVRALIQDQILITALPMTSFKTPDALAVAVGFDFALAMNPDLFSMQEIVDWREEYLNSNGGVNKDDLRREINRRAPNQRDPMEMLGLHESFFEEVKELRELANEKAWDFRIEESKSLDFSKPITGNSEKDHSDRLRNLAKTDRTLLLHETVEWQEEQKQEWNDWLASDEYKKEQHDFHEEMARDVYLEDLRNGEECQKKWEQFLKTDEYQDLNDIEKASKKRLFDNFMQSRCAVWLRVQIETNEFKERWEAIRKSDEFNKLDDAAKKLKESNYLEFMKNLNPFELERKNNITSHVHTPKHKSQPVIGIPSGGVSVKSYKDNPVYYHEDYFVTQIYINPRNDGWHEIHYENEHERFITTTKHAFIASSYKVGQNGVWTISYNDGKLNYIQPFGGGDEKSR